MYILYCYLLLVSITMMHNMVLHCHTHILLLCLCRSVFIDKILSWGGRSGIALLDIIRLASAVRRGKKKKKSNCKRNEMISRWHTIQIVWWGHRSFWSAPRIEQEQGQERERKVISSTSTAPPCLRYHLTVPFWLSMASSSVLISSWFFLSLKMKARRTKAAQVLGVVQICSRSLRFTRTTQNKRSYFSSWPLSLSLSLSLSIFNLVSANILLQGRPLNEFHSADLYEN